MLSYLPYSYYSPRIRTSSRFRPAPTTYREPSPPPLSISYHHYKPPIEYLSTSTILSTPYRSSYTKTSESSYSYTPSRNRYLSKSEELAKATQSETLLNHTLTIELSDHTQSIEEINGKKEESKSESLPSAGVPEPIIEELIRDKEINKEPEESIISTNLEPTPPHVAIRKKKVVIKKRKVIKPKSTSSEAPVVEETKPAESVNSNLPSIFRSRPPIIPNLPDVVLRKIFSLMTYKELCGIEGVCRRWMTIMHGQLRKQIQEICIERLGSHFPSANQCLAFHRLHVVCPVDSFDFLAGVFRRSRISVLRLTTDIHFLAYMDQVHVMKDAERKYFSCVEELWLLIIDCTDELTEKFHEVIPKLFSELTHLTLQIHVNPQFYENVSRIITRLVEEYPKTEINLELHADKSPMILQQIAQFPSLPLTKIKVICTDFNLPPIRLDILYEVLKQKNIMAKNITIRDWTIYADGSTPLTYHPLDTFRISSCTIQTVDDFVKCLKLTATQLQPKKVVKKLVKRKKLPESEVTPKSTEGENESKKKKIIIKRVPKKKHEPYIKKLEVAGQCQLHGLQFLENKAHKELEKQLNTSIPDMNIDCSEIYYCW